MLLRCDQNFDFVPAENFREFMKTILFRCPVLQEMDVYDLPRHQKLQLHHQSF